MSSWARALAAVIALSAVVPGSAQAATWHVSPLGADSAPGGVEKPFRTITRAAHLARAGDTVLVHAGRYQETVVLSGGNSGVVFRAAGDGPAVVDGQGRRSFGFESIGAERVTVESFELTRQTEAGVAVRGSENVVRQNLIHHVGDPAEEHSNGVRVTGGAANRVEGNTIHHVGPGAESMGIWLLETREATVQGNAVYLVRKDGIRDWKGLGNSVTGNEVALSWVGIALNTSTGSSVYENHVHDNTEGIVAKHLSSASVLDLWGLDAGRVSRVHNNTVRRSSETSLWVGQSGVPLDLLEVTANTFAGAGVAFVRDRPTLRGTGVTLDGNAYSNDGGTPQWLYKAEWTSAPGLSGWAAVRALTGWERSGPAGDAGAGGAGSSHVAWSAYPMTPVDSSSKGSYYTRAHLDKTADRNQGSYWLTEGAENEYVTFDFGQARTFDHLILTLFGHDDLRNPRGYRFEVSDDGRAWETIAVGANRDPSGAATYYELERAASGRYLRFTMVDTFCRSYAPRAGCGEYFVLSDIAAGLLGGNPDGDATAALEVARKAQLTRGSLRVTLRCVGAQRGRARVEVSARDARGRRVRVGAARVGLARACTKRVAIRVRRSLRGQLRDRELTQLRVRVRRAGQTLARTGVRTDLP